MARQRPLQEERFLFETSFDPEGSHPRAKPKAKSEQAAPQPEPEPELPAEPPAPSFSQEELDAANREAFAQGKAAGLAEAHASREQQVAQMLEAIAGSVAGLFQAQAAQAETARAEALAAALRVVESILPTLSKSNGLEIVETLVREALTHLDGEPRVLIRVGEAHAEALRGRLDAIAQETFYEGRMVLVPDASLDATSVRVESASGGVERDGERLWDEVRGLVQQRIDLLYRAGGQEPPRPLEALSGLDAPGQAAREQEEPAGQDAPETVAPGAALAQAR